MHILGHTEVEVTSIVAKACSLVKACASYLGAFHPLQEYTHLDVLWRRKKFFLLKSKKICKINTKNKKFIVLTN